MGNDEETLETTKVTKSTKTKTKKTKSKKNLVIVESPAKAKTLKKFLGPNYKIEASMGHVRDLPKSELGVDIEHDFEPKYITIRGKGDLLKALRKEVKTANKVYLATDPDREGEAISWHLYYALKLENKEVYRITFNEITKNAVKNSIKEAREIDMNLVDSQQARRTLDRVVGYQISPILWKKVKKGLSAGRVQSVALKIICDREEEIANFIPEESYTIDFELKAKNKKFNGYLHSKNGEKINIKTKEEADQICKDIDGGKYIVKKIKESTRTKKPQAPFKTSTLQQEASRNLGFLTTKTMQIAQQLYEGVDIKGVGAVGLVSYIRTDSLRISDEAYESCKVFIEENYGTEYLPVERNVYKTKGNSQDAHEAIRPTSLEYSPEVIKESLSKDQYKLYKLIWDRFIGSQMKEATYKTMSVDIDVNNYTVRVTGSILVFDGYQKVVNAQEEKDNDVRLPELVEGQEVNLVEVAANQHFTQAPPRYTEASLIKTLEELGIGRPSTYAPTISTITNRGYVSRENKILYTTELGEIINEIMEDNFANIIDSNFTAKMEQSLDKIENGEIEWKEILREFYPSFKEELELAEEKIEHIEIKDEETDVICDKCGRNMVIKTGKFGKFLACPGFPDCMNTKPFFEDAETSCPKCKSKVFIKKTKKGRKYFGCEKNPECDFMSWYKPLEKNCPKCGSYLVEKGNKNVKITCSSETCDYHE